MIKSLWLKFLLLLIAVSTIALSAAFLLRELMVSDFRGYLEGEKEDRVYWVTAAIESTYEKYSGWEEQPIIENTIWALMLGLDVKLYDEDGELVMDSAQAIDSLSPLIRKRVMAISRVGPEETKGKFVPYVLFLRGNEIGKLEVRFMPPVKESLFIKRSNGLLLISVLALGGFAVVLSIVFSRKLTNPIKGLTDAVIDVGEGNLKRRVRFKRGDELGKLAGAFNNMAQKLETHESIRRKMTAYAAHELRTPISSVRGELEGIMDGLIPPDKEHLQSLYAEIGRLKSIVEGMEALSQAEASGLTLREERFELEPFLKNITDRFRIICLDKGIALELVCDKGIEVKADPDKLSQIIINLLSNALKATEQGGRIAITGLKTGRDLLIRVEDNGAGIKGKDLPFIFERFYKASEGGLGLGLTIVRELVEAHGGKITVESEYDKGSTFTVALPL
jgi:two-component system sensor histidine kinase BaeS